MSTPSSLCGCVAVTRGHAPNPLFPGCASSLLARAAPSPRQHTRAHAQNHTEPTVSLDAAWPSGQVAKCAHGETVSQESAKGVRPAPSQLEHETFCSCPHYQLSTKSYAEAERRAPVDGGCAGHLGTRLHVVAAAHAERGRVRLLPALDAVHLPDRRVPPLRPRAPSLTRDMPVPSLMLFLCCGAGQASRRPMSKSSERAA